jgi:hypothetical protein
LSRFENALNIKKTAYLTVSSKNGEVVLTF